jgi:hypothetical protein
MLWGQLIKVGKEDDASVIRAGVVFDETSYEVNSKKYMKDYFKTLGYYHVGFDTIQLP